MTYKLIRNYLTGEIDAALRIDSDTQYSSFTFAPANTDYQAYLKWLEEGNTPEEAE